MSGEQIGTTLDTLAVECPNCTARLVFQRSSNPQIDSSGFEGYRFECKCGGRFIGIIDPYDDGVLLSELNGKDKSA